MRRQAFIPFFYNWFFFILMTCKARNNLMILGKSVYMIFIEKILMRLLLICILKLPFSTDCINLCTSSFPYGQPNKCQVQMYLYSFLKWVPKATCHLGQTRSKWWKTWDLGVWNYDWLTMEGLKFPPRSQSVVGSLLWICLSTA